jgi:hypothetical protein
MRILIALTLFAAACGGPKQKKETSLVTEGSDTAPTCCCKTIPQVGEHEIIPEYNMKERMECSTSNGECVDDVQCSNSQGSNSSEGTPSTGTGGPGEPPPPPTLPSSP